MFMCKPSRLKPFVAIDFVVADDGAYARGENLCSAAGHGVHASFAQFYQSLVDGQLGAARKIGDFHHGESLDVYFGEAFLEPTDQIEKVLEGKVGMKTADNVKLGDSLTVTGSCRLIGLFQGHGVTGWIALL